MRVMWNMCLKSVETTGLYNKTKIFISTEKTKGQKIDGLEMDCYLHVHGDTDEEVSNDGQ